MKLSNIVNGMTVKNYKAMCELLEEPVKVGKSKQLQIKDWDRFFTYEKQGNKFTNIQLREEVLEKVDNRGGARENAGREADYPFLSELCSYYINKFIEPGKPFTCNSLLYNMDLYAYNPSHPTDATQLHKAFVGCTLSELEEKARTKYAIGIDLENKRGQYIIEKQKQFQEEIARIKNALASKAHAAIAKSGIKTKQVWVINGEVATEKQTVFIETVKKNTLKVYEKRYGKFIGGNIYNTRRLYDMENKMIKSIIEMCRGIEYEDEKISLYKALVVEEFSKPEIESVHEYEEKRVETAEQMAQKLSKRYTKGYTYNGEKHTETINQEKAEAVKKMFDTKFDPEKRLKKEKVINPTVRIIEQLAIIKEIKRRKEDISPEEIIKEAKAIKEGERFMDSVLRDVIKDKDVLSNTEDKYGAAIYLNNDDKELRQWVYDANLVDELCKYNKMHRNEELINLLDTYGDKVVKAMDVFESAKHKTERSLNDVLWTTFKRYRCEIMPLAIHIRQIIQADSSILFNE